MVRLFLPSTNKWLKGDGFYLHPCARLWRVTIGASSGATYVAFASFGYRLPSAATTVEGKTYQATLSPAVPCEESTTHRRNSDIRMSLLPATGVQVQRIGNVKVHVSASVPVQVQSHRLVSKFKHRRKVSKFEHLQRVSKFKHLRRVSKFEHPSACLQV